MKKYMYIWIVMLVLSAVGCRVAFYGAIGPQSVDEVEVKLTKLKADPNIPEIKLNLGVGR